MGLRVDTNSVVVLVCRHRYFCFFLQIKEEVVSATITDNRSPYHCQDKFVTNHLLAPFYSEISGYYDNRIGMLNGDPNS